MLRRLHTLVLLASVVAGSAAAQPVALRNAHAHNDYEHARPLLDALDHGFGSVEADVHLVDGELLVAHDPEDVQPGRTLERLYLDPLRERVRRNGGRVYPDGEVPLILLIDIKTDAEATYAALQEVLPRYADVLTRFADGVVEEGAVTAIISGNRPRETMAAERLRFAAYDGRLDDLDATPSPPVSLIPLVSSNWFMIGSWDGTGAIPEETRQKLLETVRKAHAQGRKIRFWATPDRPAVWRELHAAGVDLLNADDLAGLRDFLLGTRN